MSTEIQTFLWQGICLKACRAANRSSTGAERLWIQIFNWGTNSGRPMFSAAFKTCSSCKRMLNTGISLFNILSFFHSILITVPPQLVRVSALHSSVLDPLFELAQAVGSQGSDYKGSDPSSRGGGQARKQRVKSLDESGEISTATGEENGKQ